MAANTKQYQVLPRQEMLEKLDNRRFTIQIISCDPDPDVRDNTPTTDHLKLLVNRTIHNPALVNEHGSPGAIPDAPHFLAADKDFLEGWVKVFGLDTGASIVCQCSRRTVMSWAVANDFYKSLNTYLKNERMREVAEKLVFRTDIKDSKVDVWTPVTHPGYIGRVTVEFWPAIKEDEELGVQYDLPVDPMKPAVEADGKSQDTEA